MVCNCSTFSMKELNADNLLCEVKTYQTWYKMDKVEWSCILTSMSRIMRHQHESKYTAYDIMVNLKVMFGDQDHDDRQVGIDVFFNTKMTNGTPDIISF